MFNEQLAVTAIRMLGVEAITKAKVVTQELF